jgi:hypothetical protein
MEDQPILIGSILGVVGIVTLAGAIKNWDWFFGGHRAWIFVKLVGRDGARLFYGVLGVAMLAGGVAFATGVLE